MEHHCRTQSRSVYPVRSLNCAGEQDRRWCEIASWCDAVCGSLDGCRIHRRAPGARCKGSHRMTPYVLIKAIHIISSTVLFGTGLGTAFFKWIVDRSGNIPAIRVVSGKVVLADWLFTSPAIVV